VIALLSVRTMRRKLPYELWKFLHLLTYVVLMLGFGHQFANGQELHSPPGRYVWMGLYGLVIAAVVWGRLLGPLLLNARHGLRVAEVVAEGPGMISVYVSGDRLAGLKVHAGQFLRWRFLDSATWWQSHPFSLSAAPNGHWLRLTAKVVGHHTSTLRSLAPGTRVMIGGPAGDFTAERRVADRAVLVAAGSGIAPVRALLEELPPGAVVIYRASRDGDLVFQAELESLAQARGAKLWYVVGSRRDPGPRHLFTPRGLHELVPDIAARDVYLCGPADMMRSVEDVLDRLGVPARQVHTDVFEF